MMNTDLHNLSRLDNLIDISFGDHKCYLHDLHRWTVPIVALGQQSGLLPKPCTLVTFDRHDDTLPPYENCLAQIKQLRLKGFDIDDLLFLSRELDEKEFAWQVLSPLNDDWITAGMELGLIDDVVSFGADCYDDRSEVYTDHCGELHYLERIESLPGSSLNRELGNIYANQTLLQILGWQPNNGFTGDKNFLLDIDLDCFTFEHDGVYSLWETEHYESEFIRDFYDNIGWTGQRFIHDLIDKSGLITIAREPEHCGSWENSNTVLQMVNSYLFSNRLNLPLALG